MEIIIECQSCGKDVYVPDNFFGCVFCEECRSKEYAWSANSEDFHKKERVR